MYAVLLPRRCHAHVTYENSSVFIFAKDVYVQIQYLQDKAASTALAYWRLVLQCYIALSLTQTICRLNMSVKNQSIGHHNRLFFSPVQSNRYIYCSGLSPGKQLAELNLKRSCFLSIMFHTTCVQTYMHPSMCHVRCEAFQNIFSPNFSLIFTSFPNWKFERKQRKKSRSSANINNRRNNHRKKLDLRNHLQRKG